MVEGGQSSDIAHGGGGGGREAVQRGRVGGGGGRHGMVTCLAILVIQMVSISI